MTDTPDSPAQAVSGLAEVMSRVARELQGEHGHTEATLQTITAAAVQTVPGAEDCGISFVVARKRVEPRAWTSELPRAVDRLQTELGEGPCLDAVWEQEVVRVDDVRNDGRWPRFGQRAADLGVGSQLCFRLFVGGQSLGALNLYARAPGGFDDESRDIGLVFASHAAIALSGAEHEEQLRAAMVHRDVIGQAKGILMERHQLTAEQAFLVLARASSLTNRKLSDLADELSTTGRLPAG